MITCNKSFLIARCAERGYTLDEVMPCVVSQAGDEWTIDVDHPAYPRISRHPVEPRTMRLDDAPAVPFVKKVRNFAKATVQHVVAGMPTCTDEQIEERYAICQTCEFFKDSACSQCGCPVFRDRNFVSKLGWADQACPVGKWGPIVDNP